VRHDRTSYHLNAGLAYPVHEMTLIYRL